MAYTNPTNKNIISALGKTKATIYATVAKGDLLTYDSVNYGFKLADQSSSLVADAVAVQKGVSGDVIDIAIAVEFETMPSESLGTWSDNNMCAAADVGKPLYLGEDGQPLLTAGATFDQYVGRLLSRTRAILAPTVSLSGANLTLSGDASVGGTLGVTGAATLAAALSVGTTLTQTGVATFVVEDVHSAGINIATLKTLRMPATDYGASGAITPKGFATISKAGVGAMTLAAGTPGDILGIYTKTAQAHTVTTGAGITFDGTNNTATFAAAINNGMLLLCISATLWVVLTKTGITLSAV